jgi:hypothetical protein
VAKQRIEINPNPKDGIVITKVDAARRQLETAIKLWFHDDDPVSIHTLVSAAQEILHPLAKAAGTFEGVLDTIYAADGYEKTWLASVRVYHNFFKHGAKDPTATTKFNPEVNSFLIRIVIQVFSRFTGVTTHLMDAYVARFMLSHPDVHNGDPHPDVPAAIKEGVISESKAEFLRIYLESVKAQKPRLSA